MSIPPLMLRAHLLVVLALTTGSSLGGCDAASSAIEENDAASTPAPGAVGDGGAADSTRPSADAEAMRGEARTSVSPDAGVASSAPLDARTPDAHAYDANSNGASMLRVAELVWDAQGWPVSGGP